MAIVTVKGTTANDNLTAPAGDVTGSQYYYDGGAAPNATNSPNGGSDTVTTGNGNDTVYLGYNNGNDSVTLGSGNDSVIGATSYPHGITGGAHDTFNAGAGNDTVDTQLGGYDLINGSSQSGSSLYVYMHSDTIGNDTVNVHSNATVLGSQGNDSIVATGTVNGILDGQEGNNTIDASTTVNEHLVIYGGSGNSLIKGGNFVDEIITYNGNNTVYTDSGSDTVHVGSGNNQLYLGTGGNTVFFTGGHDTVNIASGHGHEVLSYGFAAAGLSVNLSGGSSVDSYTFGGNANNIEIQGSQYGSTSITGGNGNETLTGIGSNNFLQADNIAAPAGVASTFLNLIHNSGSLYNLAASATAISGVQFGSDVFYGDIGNDLGAILNIGVRLPYQINYVVGVGSESFTVTLNETASAASVNIAHLMPADPDGVAETGAWTAYNGTSVVGTGTFSAVHSNSSGQQTVSINPGSAFNSLVFTATNDGDNGSYTGNNGIPDNSDYDLTGLSFTTAAVTGPNSVLTAGSGHDTLIAGAGNDTMNGAAAGKDTFIFNSPELAGHTNIITNFQEGSDTISLTHVGDTVHASEYLPGLITVSGGNSVVNFGPNSSITVVGDAHLTASDFIFSA